MWSGEQSLEVGGANIQPLSGRVAWSRASGEGAGSSSACAALPASKASWKWCMPGVVARKEGVEKGSTVSWHGGGGVEAAGEAREREPKPALSPTTPPSFHPVIAGSFTNARI